MNFDGASWSIFSNWYAFDQKCGRELALMVCTESQDETQEKIEQIENSLAIFDPETPVGAYLKGKQVSLDEDLKAWDAVCKECLKMVEEGTETSATYNRLYAQLEDAMDSQALFTALGGDAAVKLRENASGSADLLEWALLTCTLNSYYNEFQKADAFAVSVLGNYLRTHKKTDAMPQTMKSSMRDYAAEVSGNSVAYSLIRFIENDLVDVGLDHIDVDAMLGLPAYIVLSAWDIASNTFLDEKLEAVEKREISNYAQKLQNDAKENVKRVLEMISNKDVPLDLDNRDEAFLKKSEDIINTAEAINEQIAQYLSVLSGANEQNEGMSLGFLEEINAAYSDAYSDDALLSMIKIEEENSTESTYNDKTAFLLYSCPPCRDRIYPAHP